MISTKRAHQCTVFQTLCHFWNQNVRVYSNFASLFSVMKDNSSVSFFSSNLIYFGQKQAIEAEFLDFWVFGWNFTKFLMSNLKVKQQFSFSLNFVSLFSVTRETLLYFFSWNFIWFLWYFHGIHLSKVQNVWAKNLQRSYV